MNIWIINHYAVTPEFPGGTRHYDFAESLVRQGHTVTVFASGFIYSSLQESQTYDNKPFSKAEYEGIRWYWIKTKPYQNNSAKRMLNMISFARNLAKTAKNIPSPDVIMGSSVHPLTPLVASRIAKKRRLPFVFEIRDLWPQTLIDNGSWFAWHPLALAFRWIEKKTVLLADGIVTLSPKTIPYLEEGYDYPRGKIVLIPNGTHINPSPDFTPTGNEKIRFMYVGGVDRVHKLEDLIAALRTVQETNADIVFEIVGNGKDKDSLIKKAEETGLKNVTFTEAVKKSEVPEKLKQADVLFLSTGEVFYGSENKLGEYLNAAKPVITYTPAKHNDVVEEHDCGLSAAYSDIQSLADTILHMADMSESQRLEMGKNAYDYAKHKLSIHKLTGDLLAFFNAITEYDINNPKVTIREARKDDVADVARLHKTQIPSGFISSLPLSVVQRLYKTIAGNELLYVISEHDKVLGFVSASLNTSKLYKRFVIQNMLAILPVFTTLIFRKNFLKRSLETLKAPAKTKTAKIEDELPELLSVVVRPGRQAGGVGKMLLDKLESELKSREISKYKVVAGNKLISANRFYEKYGFELSRQTEIHKGDKSNVYIKSLS